MFVLTTKDDGILIIGVCLITELLMDLLHQHVGPKPLDLLNMNHSLIMHTIWKELPYKTAWAKKTPYVA